VLIHPPAFLTVIVPVYIPAGVLEGTEIIIGLPINGASITATKLFTGVAFHVILYVVGAPVVIP